MKNPEEFIQSQLLDLRSEIEAVDHNGSAVSSLSTLEKSIANIVSIYRESELNKQRLDLVIESTGVGIWDWYVQTGELIFNERWANIIGYTLEELSPVSIDTWVEHVHQDDMEESNRLLEKNWRGETEYYIVEVRMKHKDGHWVWIFDTGQVIEWEADGKPRRMIGTHTDITEHKRNQKVLADQKKQLEKQTIELIKSNIKLKELSETDALTNISNRLAYKHRLAKEVQSSHRANSPLSLLIIDIDHFKQYNDGYGHDNGDMALKNIAISIKSSLPRETDFVARIGGEEFIVLLPHTTSEGASQVAESIRKNILSCEIEHSFSTTSDFLTASIGISSLCCRAVNENIIFKQADTALYKAKDDGRNRCVLFTDKD